MKSFITGIIGVGGVFLFISVKSKNENDKVIKPLDVGHKLELSKNLMDLSGNIVNFDGWSILVFFEPTCNACIEEIPVWNSFF